MALLFPAGCLLGERGVWLAVLDTAVGCCGVVS